MSPWPIDRSPAAKPVASEHGAKVEEEAAHQPNIDEEELASVLVELEDIGTLDPDLKQKIIDDLRETKPELWASTVQVYRSALAYRQQVEKREAKRSEPANDVEARDLRQVQQAEAFTRQAMAESASLQRTAEPAIASLPESLLRETAADSHIAESPRPLPRAATSRRSVSDVVDMQQSVNQHGQALSPSMGESRVQQVSASADIPVRDPGNWRQDLQSAIEGLAATTNEVPRDEVELSRQVALRLLHLAAANREEAVRPIEGISPAQQDYWQKLIYSIATNVDAEEIPDSRRRAAEARRHLEDANIRLGELSNLAARNLAFCTEISSFGVYKPFEKNEFSPGQEVLLYAEVENFKSVASEKGFVTKLRSSYQILDSRGARVFDDDFAMTEDICRNRRRDFFMRYRIWIPKRIFDGDYTLKLTIEDDAKQELGQTSIDFSIREGKS
ncbi:MAG: hypothetical protein KDA42_04625 [Planctomycetales bacterium]|nr:hypothetical protein [Planctomycetales bacterium]